jgi:hypothetical protein
MAESDPLSGFPSWRGARCNPYIRKLYWRNPANVSDTMTIIDPFSGITLLRLRCEVASQSQLIDWTAVPLAPAQQIYLAPLVSFSKSSTFVLSS